MRRGWVLTTAYSPAARTLSAISLLLLAATLSFAQVQVPRDSCQRPEESPHQVRALPHANARGSTAESPQQKPEEHVKNEENQRILGIVPQFNVSNLSDEDRLTPKQKFRLAFKSAVDPGTFLFAGISSGISQAKNSFPGYGQGTEGYAKRFGASYLDSFDGTLIGNAMLPIVFHQDPRYFRKGGGSFAKRFGYAVFSTFRCKSDSAHWQPNYSNVLGNFAAGGISNLYYPVGERGPVSTYQRAIVVSAGGAIGAVVSEFWPDISHHFRKRHD
jgi:hypothetical protein